jgi:hypothetical protein
MQKITCVNNLKQIGLAVKTWAIDHNDKYPCNVSTNDSGTLELSGPDKDGFDLSTALQLRTMSNGLSTTLILVCPQDHTRHTAADFDTLQNSNVTYRLRCGTNISDANPKEVYAVCPIDGNTLYCSGAVVEGKDLKR